MNKAELITVMAEKANMTKKDTEKALVAFIESVTEELAKGEKVALTGFGAFEVAHRAARIGRNPSSGAEISIPESNAPKFKAGKALKDAVNA